MRRALVLTALGGSSSSSSMDSPDVRNDADGTVVAIDAPATAARVPIVFVHAINGELRCQVSRKGLTRAKPRRDDHPLMLVARFWASISADVAASSRLEISSCEGHRSPGPA